MGIKDFLQDRKDNEDRQYYWALVLEPEWVQVGIWQVVDGKAVVVSVSPPTAWKLDEELVEVVDTALSSCVQDLPEEAGEPSKVVFGVVSSWVSKGQIRNEYLEKIKRICSKLSLAPAGFVVLPEAVAHFFKSEEGSPLNAVVLGLSKDNIEMSVFKLGSLVGTSQIARSVSTVDDVSEGLVRFAGSDTLPSRLILYNGREGDLEDARQELLKANWEDFEKLKFLHTPKIEVVAPNRKVHAVSFAGASELGDVKTVALSKKSDEEKEKRTEEKEASVASPAEGDIKPEDLGFALETDVAAVPARKLHPDESREKEQKKGKTEDSRREKVKKVSRVESVSEAPSVPERASGRKFLFFRKNFLSGIFDSAKGGISSMLGGASTKSEFGAKLGKKALIYGAGFLLASLIVAFLFWWYYPKAKVTVYLSTRKLDEKVTLTVDPNISEPKLSERVLPGEVLKTEVTGDKTKSTTGTKTVGERARGEVTLYRVGSKLSLASGTTLHGPADLKFTLDQAVTVASGSAGTPGTTKAATTAVDIGAQYNLASGTTFKIGNYSASDVEAKNDASLSGGTSREISAVSGEDQSILEEELFDELKDDAREKLAERLSADELFIEETLSATPSSRNFSNKVGDEASTLKLSLTLKTRALTVEEKSLAALAKEVLADKVPDGFVLRADQIEVDFEFEKEVDGIFRLTAAISANLLPQVNPDGIASEIAGKYPAVAEKYLTEQIPGFVRAEISFKPKFPGRLGTLPRVVKNIEVEIASEK